ncbi:MAG TPA: nucleotidyl transferase AbiEii/AbiGii toxin family protein [Spirochaetota bacterium]|nr:nucleotidyl transferase AbiEii/AbiGii toxin family protein [Spirochaetota bacterium]
MSLTVAKYFTKEHILAHSLAASPVLTEQAVHCLQLVAELNAAGLPFRFKGGNSLLILLAEPRRFSIDVDIATGVSKAEMKAAVDAVIAKSDIFLKYEIREHKTKPWLPMISFYIYYTSHFTRKGENCIMLDAVLKKSPYPGQRMAVACGELYNSDRTTEVPAVAGLLADKLLTLGPMTLGIPLGKNKEGQRLKHVNDVSLLLTQKPDLDSIRTSIRACLEQENELQRKPRSLTEVYQDTLHTCALTLDNINFPDIKNETTVLDELARGVDPFAAHLFSHDYSWSKLQLDLARTAFCFTAVVYSGIHPPAFIQQLELPKDPLAALKSNNSRIRQLAAINPEAAYYWDCTAVLTKDTF